MEKHTNLTDRDVVSTGRDSGAVAVFRMPGVSVEGYDRGSTTETKPDSSEDAPSRVLSAPKNLAVEESTIRAQASGQNVVDVVITFDSVEGAVDYEVRVSKV